MSELPEGWIVTELASVSASYQAGFASGQKDVDGGLPHLRMNNIGVRGELVLDLLRTVPESLAQQQHILEKSDVLICTTNSSKLVGKCALFDLDGRYAFSNHLTRLRPLPEVMSSSFLMRQLRLLWQRGQFEDKCKHWVNQSALPKEELLKTPIALPPFAEQRRIVAKLETLLGKVDACQRRLAKIPVILKRFRQAVLAAACSGELTVNWRAQNPNIESASILLNRLLDERREQWEAEGRKGKYHAPEKLQDEELSAIPENWLWINFDHCASEITVGYVGPMKDRYVDRGIMFLRSQNVRPLRYDPRGLIYIPSDFHKVLSKSKLKGGEIFGCSFRS